MKNHLFANLSKTFFLFSILQVANANANEKSEMAACKNIGLTLVNANASNQKITNMEVLYTWRASCAEKPPTGEGDVLALCDGDLVSKNGVIRRIFYWEKIKNNGERHIGYHLCPKN